MYIYRFMYMQNIYTLQMQCIHTCTSDAIRCMHTPTYKHTHSFSLTRTYVVTQTHPQCDIASDVHVCVKYTHNVTM